MTQTSCSGTVCLYTVYVGIHEDVLLYGDKLLACMHACMHAYIHTYIHAYTDVSGVLVAEPNQVIFLLYYFKDDISKKYTQPT